MARLKTILVKFDGVLHAYTSGWEGPAKIRDGPVPGAMVWLLELVRRFSVTIYSMRGLNTDGLWAMKDAIRKWCRMEGIPNQDAEWMLGRLRWHGEKPVAWLTIGDRAWQFGGKYPTMQEIEDFTPWNRAEPPAPPKRRARRRAAKSDVTKES